MFHEKYYFSSTIILIIPISIPIKSYKVDTLIRTRKKQLLSPAKHLRILLEKVSRETSLDVPRGTKISPEKTRIVISDDMQTTYCPEKFIETFDSCLGHGRRRREIERKRSARGRSMYVGKVGRRRHVSRMKVSTPTGGSQDKSCLLILYNHGRQLYAKRFCRYLFALLFRN